MVGAARVKQRMVGMPPERLIAAALRPRVTVRRRHWSAASREREAQPPLPQLVVALLLLLLLLV